MHFSYTVDAVDRSSLGRVGRLTTPHGVVDTPAFMPVGTLATVKGLLPEQLREAGAQMVLSNTYHLALRPGADVVAEMGGLHNFMAWDGPILTDSGGFQVFSLSRLTRLDDHHVVFRSHIDGKLFELSPETAVKIQEQLGADCIMCLDECPPHDVDPARLMHAVERTTAWARRCRDAQKRDDQMLFGIVQGGTSERHRVHSAKGLLELDFKGYAVGGLSVGEAPSLMYDTLDYTVPLLPADKPRYLMGVGRPEDILQAVSRGVDLFDCVMPTRNGRNAMAFTTAGPVRLRNSQYQRDGRPLDETCECPVCRTYSRAYLRHLFIAGEMLGPILVSWHNISHYQTLLKQLREAIREGRGGEFVTGQLAPNAGSH
ncbi:MAG: tRNA guanosine(34) transglycosylase Tgt [Planctomycetota bacterium]|nr:tRNA guanosine(34) transglycosylase Tgt [Planctomycetota bacterium]MDA1211986.1 tRNA guanosine(34) transglycosylase Tgt [Planctomycetota bacterium]